MNQDELSVVLEEYRQLYQYYSVMLDSRKALLDWYFKAVGLPAALIAATAATSHAQTLFVLPRNVMAGLLAVIFLAGFALYVTYSKESCNATNHMAAIGAVRSYFLGRFPQLETALVLDKIRHPKKGIMSLGSVKTWRGLTIATINSAIGSACYTIYYASSVRNVEVAYVILLAMHLGTAWLMTWNHHRS